jgi:SAM-dependent methyltransferase
MKRRLIEYVRAQSFHPTWGGVFVNPFFIARRGLARAVAELAPAMKGRLLDVGCGSKPYARLFCVDEYVGLDVDSRRTRELGVADAFYDGGRFPFEAASFDSVLCNQVLEHVFEPDRFVAEIARVLRPQGMVLMTVPFVWDEHEQPVDFARYSSFGLKALLERHGLTVVDQRKMAADVSVLFQLANAYLYKVLPDSAILHRIVCAAVMAPVSAAGIVLGNLLPANADLYLDQAVLARKT